MAGSAEPSSDSSLKAWSTGGAQENVDEERGWVSLLVSVYPSLLRGAAWVPASRTPPQTTPATTVGGLLPFLSWVPSLNWESFTFIHSLVAKNVYCGLTTCQALFKALFTGSEQKVIQSLSFLVALPA